MPETRLERGVFILGVLAITALGFLVVHLWHNTHDPAGTPARTTPHTLTHTPPATRPTVSTASTTSARSTTQARATTTSGPTGRTVTAPAIHTVVLVLTARIDSWLEVRSGSSTGSVLYSGTLAASSSKAFRARSLWIRFGAAGNLSARLNHRPFRLPSGTYDAVIDAHGFRRPGG